MVSKFLIILLINTNLNDPKNNQQETFGKFPEYILKISNKMKMQMDILNF